MNLLIFTIMKFVFKSFAIIVLLLITNTTKAQYFGNYTYFQNYSPFEGGHRFFDSLRFTKADSSGEYYEKFYNDYGRTNLKNPVHIKIIGNSIYHRMEKAMDSTYHLLFKLDAQKGESFYICLFEIYDYRDTAKKVYALDSILVKIDSIVYIDYDGHKRKTWKLNRFKNSSEDFIDSIGFNRSGLSCVKWGFPHLLYICNTNKIIHNTFYEDALCDSDSFYRKFGYFTYSIFSPGFNNSHLKVYPNPASDHLNIVHKSLTELSSIRIFNSLGQEIPIHSFRYENNVISIDISRLQKGMYTIQVDQSLSSIFMVE